MGSGGEQDDERRRPIAHVVRDSTSEIDWRLLPVPRTLQWDADREMAEVGVGAFPAAESERPILQVPVDRCSVLDGGVHDVGTAPTSTLEDEQGRRHVFTGSGAAVMTARRLLTILTEGASLAGRFGPEQRLILVADLPLVRISHLEVRPAVDGPGTLLVAITKESRVLHFVVGHDAVSDPAPHMLADGIVAAVEAGSGGGPLATGLRITAEDSSNQGAIRLRIDEDPRRLRDD
jgi:hypothetical protein